MLIGTRGPAFSLIERAYMDREAGKLVSFTTRLKSKQKKKALIEDKPGEPSDVTFLAKVNGIKDHENGYATLYVSIDSGLGKITQSTEIHHEIRTGIGHCEVRPVLRPKEDLVSTHA